MVISDFKILESILEPKQISNIDHFRPVRGFSIDSRSLNDGQAFVALKGKYHDGHKFIRQAIQNGASLIISGEDIPDKSGVPFVLVDDTYTASRRVASYIRKSQELFVYGITGSVGKTTTKEMLSFLLEDKFKVLKNHKTENNILGLVKTIFSLKDEKILVLEMGTNAFGEIKDLAQTAYPDVGIITFIKPVHLEGLKNIRGVYEEKISLLGVNPDMVAVLNRDDAYLNKIKFCKKISWFGRKKGKGLGARLVSSDGRQCNFLIQGKYRLLLTNPFPDFIYNALAAIAGAQLAGITLKYLVTRLNNFDKFPPLRMQVQESDNLFFLSDSYNANPYSFKQALKLIGKYPFKKIAVIADMLELGKHSINYHESLALDIFKRKFDCVLTMGEYTVYLKNKLRDMGYKDIYHCSTHKEAAELIKQKVASGGNNSKYLIFLKGSRKMELENIMYLLQSEKSAAERRN